MSEANRTSGSEAPSEWQPIETAPRAGRFLVFGGECLCEIGGGGGWPNEGWCVAERDGEDFNVINIAYYGVRIVGATHWMPLPDPPKVADSGCGSENP